MTTDTMPCLSPALALRLIAEQRDAQAWSSLVEQFGSRIHAVGLHIGGSRSAADDIAQDTFLALRAYAGSFHARAGEPDDAAASWIMRVATTCALKHVRSQSRRRRREDQFRAQAQPIAAEAPDEELTERIRGVLVALPEHHRVPLALHFFGGLDHAQMSAALGVSVVAARVRLHRALERLRQRFATTRSTVSMAAVLAAAVPPTLTAAQRVQWQKLLFSTAQPTAALGAGALVASVPGWWVVMGAAAAIPLLMVLAAVAARAHQASAVVMGPGAAALDAAGIDAPHSASVETSAGPGTVFSRDPGLVVGAPATSAAMAPAGAQQGAAQVLGSLPLVTLTCDHIRMNYVVDLFARITSTTIVMHGIDQMPEVHLEMNELPLDRALDFLCKMTGCTWKQTGPISFEIDAAKPAAPRLQGNG